MNIVLTHQFDEDGLTQAELPIQGEGLEAPESEGEIRVTSPEELVVAIRTELIGTLRGMVEGTQRGLANNVNGKEDTTKASESFSSLLDRTIEDLMEKGTFDFNPSERSNGDKGELEVRLVSQHHENLINAARALVDLAEKANRVITDTKNVLASDINIRKAIESRLDPNSERSKRFAQLEADADTRRKHQDEYDRLKDEVEKDKRALVKLKDNPKEKKIPQRLKEEYGAETAKEANKAAKIRALATAIADLASTNIETSENVDQAITTLSVTLKYNGITTNDIETLMKPGNLGLLIKYSREAITLKASAGKKCKTPGLHIGRREALIAVGGLVATWFGYRKLISMMGGPTSKEEKRNGESVPVPTSWTDLPADTTVADYCKGAYGENWEKEITKELRKIAEDGLGDEPRDFQVNDKGFMQIKMPNNRTIDFKIIERTEKFPEKEGAKGLSCNQDPKYNIEYVVEGSFSDDPDNAFPFTIERPVKNCVVLQNVFKSPEEHYMVTEGVDKAEAEKLVRTELRTRIWHQIDSLHGRDLGQLGPNQKFRVQLKSGFVGLGEVGKIQVNPDGSHRINIDAEVNDKKYPNVLYINRKLTR